MTHQLSWSLSVLGFVFIICIILFYSSFLETDDRIFRFQDYETTPDSFYDSSPSIRDNAVPVIIDKGQYLKDNRVICRQKLLNTGCSGDWCDIPIIILQDLLHNYDKDYLKDVTWHLDLRDTSQCRKSKLIQLTFASHFINYMYALSQLLKEGMT